MISRVNKRSLWTTLTVLVLLICALGGYAIATYASTPGLRHVVVVDVGHGGADGGVTGVNSNVSESEINLRVARLLKTELEALGYRAVLTRDNEGSADGGEHYNKRADMAARKSIILRSEPLAVISVHCNKFPSRERRGAQVFFNKFSPEGRALADAIQDNLNALNVKNAGRTFSALAGDYYILNCSDYPSAIVECGFLSNPEDEALLLNEDYLALLSATVASALHAYLCA